MDTSSRLSYILSGSDPIPFEDLNGTERLEVIKRVLKICGPHLKYLSGFKKIAEQMNEYQGPSASPRSVDRKVVTFSAVNAVINEETLCVWIATLSHETLGELPPGHGVRFVNEQTLFFTRRGKFILRNAEWERELRPRPDKGPRAEQVVDVAQSIGFAEVSEIELSTILVTDSSLGIRILDILHSLLSQTIGERQRRLESLKDAASSIKDIQRRTK